MEAARLSVIRFEMATPDMSPEAFAAQITRKYGDTATQDGGDVLLWCTGPDGCGGQHAYMRVDVHSKTINLADIDPARDAALGVMPALPDSHQRNRAGSISPFEEELETAGYQM